MAATPKSSTISLKLLIDIKRQKVLFAEADKDFVDFLFTLISLPLGTVTRLLSNSKDGMVGSFGKLYESVENLSDTYLEPYVNKDIVLNPKTPVAGGPDVLGLQNNLVELPALRFYTCSQNCKSNIRSPFVSSTTSPFGISSSSFGATVPTSCYVTEDPSALCPSCNRTMSTEATYVRQPKAISEASSGASLAGYVKGVVTYMIMDNLEVKPMSTISSITLLNRFNIMDISALQEKIVEFGLDEGVNLLKESLHTNSVLTNVFLLGNL